MKWENPLLSYTFKAPCVRKTENFDFQGKTEKDSVSVVSGFFVIREIFIYLFCGAAFDVA